MSDVTFNEPEYTNTGSASRAKQASFFTRITIAAGLAKDEAGAQKVMLVAAIIIALLAVAVFFLF